MISPALIKETNSSFKLPDLTCQRLTLAQIELATNNFDDSLVIGRGGFGKVYKSLSKFGSVSEVAIKRLDSASSQGVSEFETEVEILSKLRHGNLVPLIGYCCEGNEMVLVYEFMPNGTLEDHLHKDGSELSWLQLLRICVGAARGLDYLHTGTSTQHAVIHRDVKSSNILLDSNFAAKVSDFGLAKVGAINQTRTHVSTLVKGTFGYIDPMYFQSGKVTRKSDAYAFGVVLFEVLSGKKAVDRTLEEDHCSLALWAKNHFKEGRVSDIVNPRLMRQISKKCLKEFASLAVQCLHDEPKQRPMMAEVLVKLESILSREKKRAGSGVNDGRFINKVRNFFSGKTELMPANAEGNTTELTSCNAEVNTAELMLVDTEGIKYEISGAQYIQKSNNQSLRTFTYAELVSATNNCNDKEFSTNSLETIFKGWVDELTYAPTEPGVGLAICVKTTCNIEASQVDLKIVDFNHTNLAKLLGYYVNEETLSCVYEFMPNGTLKDHLHRGVTGLSWLQRLKICIGAARGLDYLHTGTSTEHGVIHRDVKSSNILLDSNFAAKVSDFGLAKVGMINQTRTHVYTLVKGTFGYLDPCYFYSGILTKKSDVYSFGVVLFEVLTGKLALDPTINEDQPSLAIWAQYQFEAGRVSDIVDRRLMGQISNECLKEFASLAVCCVHDQPKQRATMAEVVVRLESILSRESEGV